MNGLDILNLPQDDRELLLQFLDTMRQGYLILGCSVQIVPGLESAKSQPNFAQGTHRY